MADQTFSPVWDYAQVASSGLDYGTIRDGATMLLRLAETLDPLLAGGVISLGSMGGMGGKTSRTANVQQYASYTPTVLATETARPTRQSRVLGYSDITVASYGLEFASTYDEQVFSLNNVAAALDATSAMQGGPAFSGNLYRSLLGSTIAGISASVGSSANDTSLDTLIAGASAFNVDSSDPSNIGAPILVLHPQQVEHVKESARAEGAFQDPGSFSSIQGIELGQVQPNFMGLGMDLMRTNAVTTSGSAYQGALYQRGAVQSLHGDTGRLASVIGPGVRWLAIPALGILIQEVPTDAANRTLVVQFYQYMGMALGDTSVFKMTRILGAT